MDVSFFSPAKVNLYLAVTGRRPDGYHDLVSVAAPLDFGDTLEAVERRSGGSARGPEAESQFSMVCDDPAVPVDGTNLVLKAAQEFVAATGWAGGVDFRLTKRIPVNAGLGGGSSNAVAALRALNHLAGGLLAEGRLLQIAAGLGSDCALFLQNAPVVMRGRGERVDLLPAAALRRLRGRRVLLFKPALGVGTPWAYSRMIARGTDYHPTAGAEAHLADWVGGLAPAEELLANNLEPAVFEKFVALPVLLQKLREEFGLGAGMSGSGSACFALLGDDYVSAPVVGRIRQCWGSPALVQEARIV